MAVPSPDHIAQSADRAPLLDVLSRGRVQRVHVHDYAAPDIPSVLARRGSSTVYRAERALVMAQPRDQVVLAHPADPGFLDYLQELGIGPDRGSVVSLGGDFAVEASSPLSTLSSDLRLAECLAERLAPRLSPDHHTLLTPYYAGGGLEPLRQSLARRLGTRVAIEGGTRGAARLANRKDLMRAEAVRLGVPVAPGEVIHADATGEVLEHAVVRAVGKHMHGFDGAIIRGAWSSAGADVLIVRSPFRPDAVQDWLRARPHLHSYLVESLLPLESSPNIHLWIDESSGPLQIGSTEQRLGPNGKHIGNLYPCPARLLAAMETAAFKICEMLQSRGLRGPVGIDMMQVDPRGSGVPPLAVAETNARMNASSYALALFESLNLRRREADRPPAEAWVSRTDTPVNAPDFEHLRRQLGEWLYTHDRLPGVVPYNTGLLNVGEVDLVFVAATVEDALVLEREVLGRLCDG